MRRRGASVPMRVLCGSAAALFGYMAISVAVTGELRASRAVVELSPGWRCIPVGVFGLFSAVAGWVAVTGRK